MLRYFSDCAFAIFVAGAMYSYPVENTLWRLKPTFRAAWGLPLKSDNFKFAAFLFLDISIFELFTIMRISIWRYAPFCLLTKRFGRLGTICTFPTFIGCHSYWRVIFRVLHHCAEHRKCGQSCKYLFCTHIKTTVVWGPTNAHSARPILFPSCGRSAMLRNCAS